MAEDCTHTVYHYTIGEMLLPPEIVDFLSSFSTLNLNILDFIILLVLLFYAIEGYALGFSNSFADFLSFVSSLVVALRAYTILGKFLFDVLSIPSVFSNAIGFLLITIITQIIISFLIRKALAKTLQKTLFPLPASGLVGRLLGSIFGIGSALVLLAFLLTLAMSLPFSPLLKQLVSDSKTGSGLVSRTAGLEKELNKVFGEAVNETLNFFTIQPQSNEFVQLKFRTNKLRIDQVAEKEMLRLVNQERAKHGLTSLVMDERLTQLARSHSEDMFKRGYFSHYTKEGLSPFDRMAKFDITFEFAGENLALAPNVSLAIQGLMNSPGHRANILSSNFNRIGIGVMDGGIYGKMFTQEFTD